jgi:hypothetical protein
LPVSSGRRQRTALGGLKRLGPLLFCLFLITQIGGVIPSLYVETLHEYSRFDATETAAVPAVPNPYEQPRQHQPGTQNKNDQCCTLHHGMIGTLAVGAFRFEAIGIYVAFQDAWTAPVTEHHVRIDRPPRT